MTETLNFEEARVLKIIKDNKPNILRVLKEQKATVVEDCNNGAVMPVILGIIKLDIPIKEYNKLVRQYRIELPNDPEES